MSYPIGTPGQPWSEQDKQHWFECQSIKRSYQEEVVAKLETLHPQFDSHCYGLLPYDDMLPGDAQRYPLYMMRSKHWSEAKPTVLVTGGVHGYETSGVQGAIRFLQEAAAEYSRAVNLLVAPCLSPWGYETINRWNPNAIDPNRSFYAGGESPEASLLMKYVQGLGVELLAHFDLHETTDTDNSEFRPALAARDGTVHDNWNIPDGFYTVADSARPQWDFQAAVIAAVEQVTHIAPPDDNGNIIGSPVIQPGVIEYDKKKLHLCGGFSNAKYVTTTEVYPDSPKTTPENCTQAQVAAICGGLEFILQAEKRLPA